MVCKQQEFYEILDRLIDCLEVEAKYSKQTIRGIVSDVNSFKRQVGKTHFSGDGLDSNLFLKLLVIFIDSGTSYNTKARRFFSSQKISEYLFRSKIFNIDVLSGYRLEDISPTSKPLKSRYEHAEDILKDDVVDDLLELAWDAFTNNFNPQNYLLISLLLSGIKINSLNNFEWRHVIDKHGKIELQVGGKRFPLSHRVDENKFIDCLEYYKGNGNGRLLAMSKAGLVQRVYSLGSIVGHENLSSMNFRWTCLYDQMRNGLDNDEISEVYGISKNYLNRIEWSILDE